MKYIWFLTLSFILFASACLFTATALSNEKTLPADLLIWHGRIYTSNPNMPWAEAIAISDGIIKAVGTDQEIEKYRGPDTEVIDLGGRMAMPGIIDSHMHFLLGSTGLSWVHLDNIHSADEIKKHIRDYAEKNPQEKWVRGSGWGYDSFSPFEYPTKEMLDEAVPDRPAVIESCDRHSYWVNSKALELANITRDTPDPKENGIVTGEIVRDQKTGEPTGVLKESAMVLMRAVIPTLSREDLLAKLSEGMAHANRHGITAIVNASGDIPEIELYDELLKQGKLTIRIKNSLGEVAGVKHYLNPETLETFEKARSSFNSDWIRTGLIKFFMDGVVETNTAAMLMPYQDNPSLSGVTNYTKEEFNTFVTELDRRGFQVMTHAIGDAAVRMTLDAYEFAEKENGPRDRRFRVEHIEILDPLDLPRFNKLGVIASMQPLHLAGDSSAERWRKNVGPERLKEGFAWNDLISSGARLVLGSDWPIVTLDPFISMQAALTRQTPDGDPEGGWFPSQCITLDQALAGYTRQAAYAAFFDDRIGAIEPGKSADIIVLSQNLFDIPAKEIGKTKVILTIVNGKVVWRDEFKPGAQILFFHTPTCPKCSITKSTLNNLYSEGFDTDFEVKYLDVSDIDNYAWMIKLLKSHNQPENIVFPVLYLNGHFLTGRTYSPNISESLVNFIKKALAGPPQQPKETSVYKTFNISDYAKNMGLWTIIGAGLVDGINPCAFTTLIFFMSFLNMQKYTKKRLFFAGLSYIIGVFFAYTLVGFGLLYSLHSLGGFWTISVLVNIGIGVLSLILGILSIIDAIRYNRTKSSQDIILQLPKKIKERMRHMIDKAYRAQPQENKNKQINTFILIINTFSLGIIIAVFESACTGQVYLPTIMVILANAGKQMLAIMQLLLYNTLFVSPLVLIFALTFLGVTSGIFGNIVKAHMTKIKFLLALVFFILGGLLLYSYVPLAYSKVISSSEIAKKNINKNIEFAWFFGKVPEGKVVTHVFSLKNTSPQLMKIKQVNSSCACTTPDLSTWEIAPGKSSEITVRFDSKGFVGDKEGYIYLHTDDPNRPIIMLKIKAIVIPQKHT